jgi:hypothetical protein
MVIGYFALVRANRTIQDVLEAPDLDHAEDIEDADTETKPETSLDLTEKDALPERIAANDIAILPNGATAEGIVRFHKALSEMTGRRGLRDEISRYEAMSLALVEPKGELAGSVVPDFPPEDSLLRLDKFFPTLYQRYEERFVYGAPLLADRGMRIPTMSPGWRAPCWK